MHYIWFYIYKVLNNPPVNYDIDHSNNIDRKEAIFLGLALSIDSACVGIGSGIIGINDIILPILVSSFQLVFLNCGNFVAKNIFKRIKTPDKVLAIFSGVVLILVGLLRIVF